MRRTPCAPFSATHFSASVTNALWVAEVASRPSVSSMIMSWATSFSKLSAGCPSAPIARRRHSTQVRAPFSRYPLEMSAQRWCRVRPHPPRHTILAAVASSRSEHRPSRQPLTVLMRRSESWALTRACFCRSVAIAVAVGVTEWRPPVACPRRARARARQSSSGCTKPSSHTSIGVPIRMDRLHPRQMMPSEREICVVPAPETTRASTAPGLPMRAAASASRAARLCSKSLPCERPQKANQPS